VSHIAHIRIKPGTSLKFAEREAFLKYFKTVYDNDENEMENIDATYEDYPRFAWAVFETIPEACIVDSGKSKE
jgi:hypothetical protein